MLKKTCFFIVLCCLINLSNTFAFWVSVDSEVTNDNGRELSIQVEVCPPLWLLGNMVGQTKVQRNMNEELGRRRAEWERNYAEQNPGFAAVATRLSGGTPSKSSTGFWMFERSEQKKNRCSVATPVYSIKTFDLKDESALNADVISQALIQPGVLKVGIRDDYPSISKDEGSLISTEWRGAAVMFAQKIARKFGLKLELVELGEESEERFEAIEDDDVDVVISMITITEKRKKRVMFSDAYYKTGLSVGTFDFATTKVLTGESGNKNISLNDLNSPSFTFHVAEGTTAYKFVKQYFPSANVEEYDSSSEIGEDLSGQGEKRGEVATGDLFITDNAIASGWKGSYIVPVDGNELITNSDEYGVAVRNVTLQQAVNKVIEQFKISEIYHEMLGNGNLKIKMK